MVACAAAGADTSAAHAFDDILVGHIYHKHLVYAGAHFFERLCLRNGAGKAVKNEAALAILF